MNASPSLPAKAQLVVIGAGPGGYAAAFRAAELGLAVTLVDPAVNPGGVCLYRGCIPSKALLHVAKLLGDAAAAAAIGLSFGPPTIDLEQVRRWKGEVVTKLTAALGARVKQLNIDYRRGTARFKDATTLEIVGLDGSEGELVFEQAILASGSRPLPLPGLDGESDGILDSTGALELAHLPQSLLVIGGGYIGLELGSVYAALGSEVTLVEMSEGLLPGCDRDLMAVLKRRLEQQFAEILLHTKVVAVQGQSSRVQVTLEDAGGKQSVRRFEQVLVAVGRRPNTDDLNLSATAIRLDGHGFVEVDGQQRTAESHIFAVGDVAGQPLLAHKAYAEARVAAEAAAGRPALFEPRAIPAVVFTDPEIAWCGLTESAAREQGRQVKTAKLPWRGNARCLTLGRDDGLTKLLIDPESGRLLGVGMVGPGAGELIAEGVLALEMAAVAEDLWQTIHPHPTLSETLQDTAAQLVSRKKPASPSEP